MKGRRIPYTVAEMAWLTANRTLVISDYHHGFVAAFGRTDVTAAQLHGLRKRKGWKVGRPPGRTAGRHWRYSAAEIDWLGDNRTLPIAAYHRAFTDRFARTDVTAVQLHALRKRMGWRTGRTGQFVPGQVSHNKGRPCAPGTGGRHPNARRTQFKPGQLPANTKQLGHEHIRTDGYVEISVAETNPHTGFERRYVLKHLHLWQAANGPVPDCHALKCLDGDRTNTDPANWTPVPRGVLARLSGGHHRRRPAYDAAAPEVKPVLLTLARVEHQARILRRGKGGES